MHSALLSSYSRSKVAWLNCSGLLVTEMLKVLKVTFVCGDQVDSKFFSKFDVKFIFSEKSIKICFQTRFKRLLALFLVFKVTICSCHSHNRHDVIL